MPANLTDTEKIQKIESELGEVKVLFNGNYTDLVLTASKYGFGVVLGELLTKAYLDKNGIKDSRIIEGLLSMALYHCENNYCYVVHSSWLLNMGMSEVHIFNLYNNLEFPEEIEDHARWTKILRLTFFSIKNRMIAIKNLKHIESILDQNEYKHYLAIISLAGFLEFLITAYHNEIDIAHEKILQDESTGMMHEDISKFVKFYEHTRGKESSEDIPIFVICSFCKDVKDNNDIWHKIEEICTQFPHNAGFSHSVCPKCCDNLLNNQN